MKIMSFFHPQFEFLNSLLDFVNKKNYKRIDLGKKWADHVNEKSEGELQRLVDKSTNLDTELHFIHMCTVAKEVNTGTTCGDLLSWIQKYSPSHMGKAFLSTYEIEAPPSLDQSYELLSTWYTSYYSFVEPKLTKELSEVARQSSVLVKKETPIKAINAITNGLTLEGDVENLTVYLLPQFHGRPVLFHKQTDTVHIYGYAADTITLHNGELAPVYTRTQQALNDINRLKILQFIEKGPCSFKDIHDCFSLAKSTVHHHLLTLRSAGLINVHQPLGKHVWYSYRSEGLRNFEQRISLLIEGNVHE
ncbi:ArsR/SmtB family transcription factor [Alteribacter aurantiacus]|uniref:ArsR/SmtB family transcription factor n=1 Tax=Alteribacter aurantiacus TaxID=254410 RepID=UPI0003FAF6E8|nr:winged helix-turn-helix domain-containing protein [Alteribacter aurantiacus]